MKRDADIAIEIVENIFKARVFQSWHSLEQTKNENIPDWYFVINRAYNKVPDYSDIREFGFRSPVLRPVESQYPHHYSGHPWSPNNDIKAAYDVVNWFHVLMPAEQQLKFQRILGTQWYGYSPAVARAICCAALEAIKTGG